MKNNLNKKIGATLLTAAVVAGTVSVPMAKAANTDPYIEYQAHVQNKGWMAAVQSGIAGTQGKALRMEALKVDLKNAGNATLTFDVHIQNLGWKNGLTESDIIGTEGKALRLEAIKIHSKDLDGYKVQYRVHIQNKGWTKFVDEGEIAGTEGQALRLEAIEIKLVKTFTAAELAEAQKGAIDELNVYLVNLRSAIPEIATGVAADKDASTYQEVESIANAIKSAKEAIANTTSIEAIARELSTAESSIESTTKTYIKSLLDKVYNDGKGYEVKNATTGAHVETYYLTETAYNDAVTAVQNATMENAIKEVAKVLPSKVINEAGRSDAIAKEDAIAELRAYKADQYDATASSYATILATQEAAINSAVGTQNIVNALASAKTAIDNALAADQNSKDVLQAAKDAAIASFSSDIEASRLKDNLPGSKKDNYLSVASIKNAVVSGNSLISSAANSAALTNAEKTARENVLKVTKEYLQKALYNIYTNKDNTIPAGKYLIAEKYNAFSKDILEAEIVDGTTSFVQAIGKAMDSYNYGRYDESLMTIDQIRTRRINELAAHATGSAVKPVTDAVTAGNYAINIATTPEAILQARDTAKANVTSAARTYYKQQLDAIRGWANVGDTTTRKYLSDADYNTALRVIEDTKSTVAEMDTAYQTAETNRK